MSKQASKGCLDSFDGRAEPFGEYDVQAELCRFRRELEDRGETVSDDLTAEIIAFGFMENHDRGEMGWISYFGSSFVVRGDDGKTVESPTLQCVTPSSLKFWAERARQANHPILKVRYAGLVWDLSQRITGRSAGIEMPRIVIDETVKIAEGKLHRFDTDVIKKLARALAIAVTIQDKARLQALINAIVAYEDEIAEDGKLGLWGFSYDLLVANKAIQLNDDTQNRIIADLEARLERVSNFHDSETKPDPHPAEAAALRLARHYRRHGSREDVKRVLRKYGEAFLVAAGHHMATVASAWLQRVYAVYLQFGMRTDADAIAVRLRDFAKRSTEELASYSHNVEIPKDEMDKFLDHMTQGDLNAVLMRIAREFILRRDQVEIQVKDLAKSAPLSSLFPKTLIDHDGRPVAHIGNVETDLEGNIAHQMAQSLTFSAMFLRLTFARVVDKFHPTPDDILAHVYCSPIFEPDRRQILGAGIRAYLCADWLVAIHLLIPQIENALRKFVEETGGATYRMGRNGALMLKNLDELLREDRVLETFGEDVVHYLRVLFTDQRGWNLRNKVSHGIALRGSFDSARADRVFHALLLLGQLRSGEEVDTTNFDT